MRAETQRHTTPSPGAVCQGGSRGCLSSQGSSFSEALGGLQPEWLRDRARRTRASGASRVAAAPPFGLLRGKSKSSEQDAALGVMAEFQHVSSAAPGSSEASSGGRAYGGGPAIAGYPIGIAERGGSVDERGRRAAGPRRRGRGAGHRGPASPRWSQAMAKPSPARAPRAREHRKRRHAGALRGASPGLPRGSPFYCSARSDITLAPHRAYRSFTRPCSARKARSGAAVAQSPPRRTGAPPRRLRICPALTEGRADPRVALAGQRRQGLAAQPPIVRQRAPGEPQADSGRAPGEPNYPSVPRPRPRPQK